MLFAYFENSRIHISQYRDNMYGSIKCDLGHDVIARRGEKICHHFSHKSQCDCPCSDNKGDWHVEWQDRAIKECQEKRLEYQGKLHIADVCVNNYIIEIQHSNMDEKTMREREKFYTSLGFHLVWVFDCAKWDYSVVRHYKQGLIQKCDINYKSGVSFPLLGAYNTNITKILDFGMRDLFVVEKQSGKMLFGHSISLEDFDSKYLGTFQSDNNDIRIYRRKIVR